MDHISYYKEILARIKPELEEKYLVNTIGFFGSIVRDDFSPGKSDIDLIVDFKGPVGIEFIELGDYLEKVFKRKVDLVSRKGIRSQYLKAIEPEIVYV